jgi:hypothetical protein
MDDSVSPFSDPLGLGASQRHKFTKQEDDEICRLVSRFGDHDWGHVSAGLPGRTPRQCRERYKNYLCSAATQHPWTQEEECLLLQKFRELGPKWTHIAEWFPGRNNINVKNRWTLIATRETKKRALQTPFPIWIGPQMWPQFTPPLRQWQPPVRVQPPEPEPTQPPPPPSETMDADLASAFTNDEYQNEYANTVDGPLADMNF